MTEPASDTPEVVRLPPPRADAAALAYVERPDDAVGGNSVKLLVTGDEAYPAMLEAIRAAERSIWLEVYHYADDTIGRLFTDALVARAKAGLDVRVMVDALGAAMTAGPLCDELRAGGVKVVATFELRPWKRAWRWLVRDHRKLLVVDGRVAFTGGLNVGLDYAGPRYQGGGWYDLQLVVRGPVVEPLARLFAQLWRRNGGGRIAEPPRTVEEGPETVRVLANHASRTRKEIRRAYLHAFRRAQQSIVIANAYFLPGPRILHALKKAARRGVKVTIVLPGVSDHATFLHASRARYRGLLEAGARIFETREGMMHAKAAVVDGQWCTVGSCNLDAWSLRRNLELNVAVAGERMAAVVQAQLELLRDRCREVTRDECRQWSLGRRALQLACLLMFLVW